VGGAAGVGGLIGIRGGPGFGVGILPILLLGGLLCGEDSPPTGRPADAKAPDFRIQLVRGTRRATSPGALESALREAGAALDDASSGRIGDDFARGRVVVLAGAPPEIKEDFIEVLGRAIEQGAGLVALGEAAALLPDSARTGDLFGRKRVLADAPAGDTVLEVVNQSHPITQCVTHLRLPRARVRAAAGAGATELGRARPVREEPAGRDAVLWTGFRGKGRIAVLALEGGDAAGEEAIAFLAARMAQWAAGKEVTFRIPAKLPLAALQLGPADAGSLRGLAAEPGFYRGREIAPVMGWQAIAWLLRPDREETELPDKVLDALKIAEGSTVADVGAGAGYFTMRLAKRVGPMGRVLATDIQEEMLEALKERIAREGAANVEPVLATETDPKLPEGGVDLVLMVDVYHELSQPGPTAAAVLRSLRPRSERAPAGRFVLVEYRGEDPAVPIKPLHRTTELQIRAELEPLGFRWKETHEFLPHQHVIVFERP